MRCAHKKCPEFTHFDELGNCEYDFPDCGENMTIEGLRGDVRYAFNETTGTQVKLEECVPIKFETEYLPEDNWYS